MVTDPYNDPVKLIGAAAVAALLAGARPAPVSDAAARPAPASIAAWTSAGPELSQVNAVSADPSTEGRVYASASLFAASQSAVYGSEDGAHSWTPLDEAPRGEVFAEV